MSPNSQKAITIALGYLVACFFRFQSQGQSLSSTVIFTLLGVTTLTVALLLSWQAIKKTGDWTWWGSFAGFTLCLIATGGAAIVIASILS
ncbi:MAG: hypothetical protein Aurels2KO_34010 [Aureliella sp.]